MSANFFYSWIPTVGSGETFDFCFRCFIKEKIAKDQCFIKFITPKEKHPIFCKKIPEIYKSAITDYLSHLQKSLFLPQDNNSLLIFPRYISFHPRNEFRDNTIILISKGQKGIRDIEYVLIFDDSFYEFIKKIFTAYQSNGEKDYSLLTFKGAKISDWENGFYKMEIIHGKLDRTTKENKQIGGQVNRLLCDIYHLKSFHKDQTVLLDIVNTDNQQKAIERILKMYTEKISYLHKAMVIYSNSPFYYFINFLYVRMIQNFIKMANGEIQFAKNFVYQFISDAEEKKKWENKFKFASESLLIPTARIESRWRFITSLGLMVTVFLFFTNFFSKNPSLFGVDLSPVLTEVFFIFLLMLFAIVVGQIFLSFSILLIVDFYEQFIKDLKKMRIIFQLRILLWIFLFFNLRSPMARLVRFLIGLTILGVALAIIPYFAGIFSYLIL